MYLANDVDDRLQVYTEWIRLTNEDAVKEQTDEDGDLFLWFKHQAFLGTVNAQVMNEAVDFSCASAVA
jgi:hypothetical protein